MDLKTVLTASVVAAIVSACVSLFTTYLTLKAAKKRDRFDRLFPLIDLLSHKLRLARLDRPDQSADVSRIAEFVKNLDSIHADILATYLQCSAYFDSDVKQPLKRRYDAVLRTQRERNLDPAWIAANTPLAVSQFERAP
jgi:hypothetical protein